MFFNSSEQSAEEQENTHTHNSHTHTRKLICAALHTRLCLTLSHSHSHSLSHSFSHRAAAISFALSLSLSHSLNHSLCHTRAFACARSHTGCLCRTHLLRLQWQCNPHGMYVHGFQTDSTWSTHGFHME